MKIANMQSLERTTISRHFPESRLHTGVRVNFVLLTYLQMVERWMCGVSLKVRKVVWASGAYKSGDEWVSACRNVVVAGVRCAGRCRQLRI